MPAGIRDDFEPLHVIDIQPTFERSAADTPLVQGPPALLRVMRWPADVLLFLIKIYQRTLSPALPVIFGSACGCRFSPTCSHYTAGAIRTHGAILGTLLGLVRLVKCTPLHPGGFDPVPPRRSLLRCERITS
jgi:putative membrane protein insertion efficiency factor